MKIRSGLVSNSSSTSFTLYGFSTHRNKLGALMLQTEKGKKALEENADGYYKGDVNKLAESSDAAESLPHIQYGNSDYDDDLYFGRDLYDMRMDQTRAEFQAEVEQEIREWLGDEAANNCSTYSDSWYNG